ncbi:MAG TPA: hypothetical protein VFC37_04860 [Terracidiphilus sp.]|jgi:hypothetical protein|nr:hypothetical protein [Terracidiphilus sp.]
MKCSVLCLTLVLFTGSAALFAQSSSLQGEQAMLSAPATSVSSLATKPIDSTVRPFSRLALGGGVSPLGINMQVAVNASRYINLRGVGNLFNYNVNNISTNGLNINGKLNFATAGASVDFYPFPNHGFRLSPGALFYNQNNVAADVTVAGGTSFTLNGVTYYASSTNPIKGNGALGLNSRNPTFAMTTGWGNMIPRRGGHWSFPFEIGAAFVGAPTINMGLTSGQACDAQGQNCVNVATDPTVQANLQAQLVKYRNDVNPFQYYPIINFGAAYNFKLR